MKGFLGFWVILLLIASAFYYWYIALPILAVLVVAAVVGGQSTQAKAQEAESADFEYKVAALKAARQWALDQNEADAKKKVIAELQAQAQEAELRNEIAKLDAEWARLNKEDD